MVRRELMTINDKFSIFLKPFSRFNFIIVVHIFLILILVFPSPRLQRGGCRRLYWRFVPIRRIRGKASHIKSDWPNVTQPSIRKFRKKFVSSPTKRHPINASPPPPPNHKPPPLISTTYLPWNTDYQATNSLLNVLLNSSLPPPQW